MIKSVRFLRFSITLLMFLMISGCSKSSTQSSTQSVSVKPFETVGAEDDGVYIASIKRVGNNKTGNGYVGAVFHKVETNEDYSIVNRYDSEEQRTKVSIRVSNADTGEVLNEIDVQDTEEKNLFIMDILPISEEVFVCSGSVYHGMEQENYIFKISANGEILDKKNLSEMAQIQEKGYLYSGLIYDETYLYVPIGGKLIVLDDKFRYVRSIDEDEYSSFCLGSDGLVYFKDGYNGDISSYDGKRDKVSEKIVNIPSAYSIHKGTDDELLVATQSSLKSYNTKTCEVTKLFDFLDVNITASSFDTIYRDASGDIHIRYSQYDYDTADLQGEELESTPVAIPYDACVKRYEKGEVPEVEEIRLACFYANPDIKESVCEYNLEHPETKIRVKSYNDDYSDYTQMEDAFKQDILNGVVYDIIMFNSSEIEDYISKNLVEDLMPYIEGDSSFDVSKYFGNILFSDKKEDGKLYRIVSGAQIVGFMGDSRTFGNTDTLTLDDIFSAREENADIPFLSYGYNANAFYIMIQNDYRLFLGGEVGNYNFRTEEFKKLCEFANTFPAYNPEKMPVSSEDYLRSGVALIKAAYYYSTEGYLLDRARYGKNFKTYGAPSYSGNGYYISLGTSYSISSQSSHKEEAWEIIKWLLDADPKMMNYEFRANRAVFESSLDDIKNACKSGYSIIIDDEEYTLFMNESDYEILEQMVSGASPTVSLPPVIDEIMEEELSSYFSGQKSLDEVINIIEKRVDLYLEEKK